MQVLPHLALEMVHVGDRLVERGELETAVFERGETVEGAKLDRASGAGGRRAGVAILGDALAEGGARDVERELIGAEQFGGVVAVLGGVVGTGLS